MAVSKRVRFEVFKRDAFTCQYCGRRAPDVVLHVDHCTPLSNGGSDDKANLVTACADCNGGKSSIPIDLRGALGYSLAVQSYFNAVAEGFLPQTALDDAAGLRQWVRYWMLLDDLARQGCMPFPGEAEEHFEARTGRPNIEEAEVSGGIQ